MAMSLEMQWHRGCAQFARPMGSADTGPRACKQAQCGACEILCGPRVLFALIGTFGMSPSYRSSKLASARF